MSLSGSVEDLPLLEILQVVAYCQKTGHLLVRAPEGEAGVVFRDGRVVSGYIWDVPPAPPGNGPGRAHDAQVHSRIAAILERLVRLREGEFAFNLTEQVPTRLGGRDLSAEMLEYGINPEELMLDLARKLDEDRRDGAAEFEASFSASPTDVAEPPAAAAAPQPPPPEAPSAPEAPALPAIEASPKGPTVLFVDDEPEVCRVVGRQLADAGFEVVVAGSAGHARREMERLAAEPRRFVLVVDLGLPSEVGASFKGGLEVARHASGLPTPPPVVLTTESADEKLRGRVKRLGVSLIAYKPGLSKLDPLQYEADLRAFADRLACDMLPRLEGRRRALPQSALPVFGDRLLQPSEIRAALGEITASPRPDAVAFLLLHAARSFFLRGILFVSKDDALRGVSGFGEGPGETSLDLLARRLSVPLHDGCPFADAVANGRAWAGPIPPRGAARDLLDAIGPLHANAAAIVPVRAFRHTIAVIYGDCPDGSELPRLEPFLDLVEEAGRALDAALLARRTSQSPPC